MLEIVVSPLGGPPAAREDDDSPLDRAAEKSIERDAAAAPRDARGRRAGDCAGEGSIDAAVDAIADDASAASFARRLASSTTSSRRSPSASSRAAAALKMMSGWS
jgi:hypothetical protein